jgi:hypothetical protein
MPGAAAPRVKYGGGDIKLLYNTRAHMAVVNVRSAPSTVAGVGDVYPVELCKVKERFQHLKSERDFKPRLEEDLFVAKASPLRCCLQKSQRDSVLFT